MQSKYKTNVHPLTRFRVIVMTALAGLLFFASCKKFTEVPAPVNSLNSSNVYNDDKTATAVLTGIYTTISNNDILFSYGFNQAPDFANISMSVIPALSADELILFDPGNLLSPYYYNELLSTSPTSWASIYHIVFVCNSAIEGLNGSTTLTPAVKQQLLGEAKFMRGFCYFYLVNLYGDVPLVLSTDYKVIVSLPRTPKTLVYQQVITDLKDAKSLLNPNYVDASVIKTTNERVRPNKAAATAMLARAYLYSADYIHAEAEATEVISNPLYSLSALNDVFLANSSEAIWQIQPVGTSDYIYSNTEVGNIYVLTSDGPSAGLTPFYLSPNVVNSFETGDLRKDNWTGNVTVGTDTYYYPYKYKIGNTPGPTVEYNMVLRLAEQYLIRAEARAQQGNAQGAADDLNVIRVRAGLGNTTASTQATLLSAVAQERKVELFTEWGDRWFDLKRTGKINDVMTVVAPQKGGTWTTDMQLYPIPLGDLKADPKLVQNPGYTQ